MHNGDTTEQYECFFSSCPNPVCTCGTVQLSLFPLEHEDQNKLISPYKVNIDIINRKLDDKDESKPISGYHHIRPCSFWHKDKLERCECTVAV